MRELIKDEISYISGADGSAASCESMGAQTAAIITADGAAVAVVAAVAVPAVGAVGGALIIAFAGLVGAVVGSKVTDACKAAKKNST